MRRSANPPLFSTFPANSTRGQGVKLQELSPLHVATEAFVRHGCRKSLSADLKSNLEKIKKVARIPVCVGFGISNAHQLRQVQKVCDGGIVGSAIVNNIRENITRGDLVKRVGNFVERFNVQKS